MSVFHLIKTFDFNKIATENHEKNGIFQSFRKIITMTLVNDCEESMKLLQ